MLEKIRQRFPFRRRPAKDMLVKVAGTIHQVEVEVWTAALQRQGVNATIRELPPEVVPPTGRASWEVWVRASDEPKARLILGLSGRSVIRLPRQKPGRE